MKKVRVYIPYIILSFVLLFFIVFGYVYRTESNRIIAYPPVSMSDGWVVDDSEPITIPIQLDIEKNQAYTIKTTLNDDFYHREVILVRTSLSNIDVHLDGISIYRK